MFFFIFFYLLSGLASQSKILQPCRDRSSAYWTLRYQVLYCANMHCSKTKPSDPVVPEGIKHQPLVPDYDTLTTKPAYSLGDNDDQLQRMYSCKLQPLTLNTYRLYRLAPVCFFFRWTWNCGTCILGSYCIAALICKWEIPNTQDEYRN